MNKTNQNLSLLTKEQRQSAINEIIDFFSTERDERIGVIAAEDILDFFLQTIGTSLYNKGVVETKEFVKNHLDETITDIEISLKK